MFDSKKYACSILTLLLCWNVRASSNYGLGPIEVRDQFPITLRFLSMTPGHTKPIGNNVASLSYQFVVTNTFLNSQGATQQISDNKLEAGLEPSDFYDKQTHESIPGYHNYIDVESHYHRFSWKYGLSENLELGLNLVFVSLIGGAFDHAIEEVHRWVGIDNAKEFGAYRANNKRDQYYFFVALKDRFLIASEQEVYTAPSDPVLDFKWTLTEGNDFMPAIAIKTSVKFPAPKNGDSPEDQEAQELLSNGKMDWGMSALFSKGFEYWVIHLGWAKSRLGENDGFVSELNNRYVTFELRHSLESSTLFQFVSLGSVYPEIDEISGVHDRGNVSLSRDTEILVVGYKYRGKSGWIWDMGFVEDFSQFSNQTDISLFFELGIEF